MTACVEFVPGNPHRVEVVAADGSRECVWQGESYLDAMAEAREYAKALGCPVVRQSAKGAAR